MHKYETYIDNSSVQEKSVTLTASPWKHNRWEQVSWVFISLAEAAHRWLHRKQLMMVIWKAEEPPLTQEDALIAANCSASTLSLGKLAQNGQQRVRDALTTQYNMLFTPKLHMWLLVG